MRRNLASVLKFALLCGFMVVLTVFFYKTLFSTNRHEKIPVASAQQMHHPRQGAFFMGSDKNIKEMKIDWHDYKFIDMENARHGIGEHGEPAFLSTDLEDERRKLFDQNGFNGLLSDKIALNRSVKDIRHKE